MAAAPVDNRRAKVVDEDRTLFSRDHNKGVTRPINVPLQAADFRTHSVCCWQTSVGIKHSFNLSRFLGTGKELPGVTFAQVPSEVRSNRQKADRTFGSASKVGQYHRISMTDYHLAH